MNIPGEHQATDTHTTREDRLDTHRRYPDRLFYALGVLLDARDFDDEQTYHRGRLGRALAYLHGSGTAAGLRVVWDSPLTPGADPQFPGGRVERLMVEPGIAIDRLGRIIEVPESACMLLGEWYQWQAVNHAGQFRQSLQGSPAGQVTVDVFIRFIECKRGKTPALAAGPYDALDAVQPSRIRDFYDLELAVRTEADPPLPISPWPDLAAGTEDERRDALHEAIFNAWREGAQWDEFNKLRKSGEHTLTQDPTSLFLARLAIPADPGATDDDPPVRTAGADVQVDNTSRQFVYSTGAIARWLGLPFAPPLAADTWSF
jgi:hypothetical protein